jgi:hypothetical protein
MIEYTEPDVLNLDEEKDIFDRTFNFLNTSTAESTFKRYNETKDRFEGKFLLSAFEAIGVGTGMNITTLESKTPEEFTDRVKEIWNNDLFTSKTGSGVNVTSRVPVIIPLGIDMLNF